MSYNTDLYIKRLLYISAIDKNRFCDIFLLGIKQRGSDVMEKVICIQCGSIGYTASPKQVPCSCGGKHRVISSGYRCFQNHKHNRMISLLGTKSG